LADAIDWEAYGRDTRMSEVHLRDAMHAQLVRDFVEFFSDWDRDAYILDVGCGDGFWMETLRNLGFRRVVGFDCAESALERAAEKGLDVRQGDLYDFDVANAFDVILLCDTLEHLPDARDALARVHRALRTHGCLYLAAPVYESLRCRWARMAHGATREDQARSDDETHLHAFASTELLDLLEGLNFSVEGSAHIGNRVPWSKSVRATRDGGRFGDWFRVAATSLFKVHGAPLVEPTAAAQPIHVGGLEDDSTVPTAGAPGIAAPEEDTDLDDEPETVLHVD
jgi:SAM-dependent methyltransferase